jgi:hypothetical protein
VRTISRKNYRKTAGKNVLYQEKRKHPDELPGPLSFMEPTVKLFFIPEFHPGFLDGPEVFKERRHIGIVLHHKPKENISFVGTVLFDTPLDFGFDFRVRRGFKTRRAIGVVAAFDTDFVAVLF